MVAKNSLINLPKNKLLGISPVEHPCWNPHVWSSLFWYIPRSQKIGFSDTVRNQNKVCFWQKSTYFILQKPVFSNTSKPQFQTSLVPYILLIFNPYIPTLCLYSPSFHLVLLPAPSPMPCLCSPWSHRDCPPKMQYWLTCSTG